MFRIMLSYLISVHCTQDSGISLDDFRIQSEQRIQSLEEKIEKLYELTLKAAESRQENPKEIVTPSKAWFPGTDEDYKKIRMMAKLPLIDPVKVYELLTSIIDRYPEWQPASPQDLVHVEMPEDLNALVNRIKASPHEFWCTSWASNPRLKHLLLVGGSAQMDLDGFQRLLVSLMLTFFTSPTDAQLGVKHALEGGDRTGLLSVVGHVFRAQLLSEIPVEQRGSFAVMPLQSFGFDVQSTYLGQIPGFSDHPLSSLYGLGGANIDRSAALFMDSETAHAARLGKGLSLFPADSWKLDKARDVLRAIATSTRFTAFSEYLFFADTKDNSITAKAEKGGILFNFLYNFIKDGWMLDVTQATTPQHNSTEFNERILSLHETIRNSPLKSSLNQYFSSAQGVQGLPSGSFRIVNALTNGNQGYGRNALRGPETASNPPQSTNVNMSVAPGNIPGLPAGAVLTFVQANSQLARPYNQDTGAKIEEVEQQKTTGYGKRYGKN